MRISAIISSIEQYAHPSLQESWDNTGLQVGNPAAECTGVLVCLEPTPAVVDEAVKLGCNLIISHHPLFFRPIKKLTGQDMVSATALEAIAHGIVIYSSHTASDSTRSGVSTLLAQRLGIKPKRVLSPLDGQLVRLETIVPTSKVAEVQTALFDAGAGSIGNYDCCSFSVDGNGTFRALAGANPAAGEIGKPHIAVETALNMVMYTHVMPQVEKTLLEVHPYEVPAYSFTPILNNLPYIGLGIYGISEQGLSQQQFVEHVKDCLGCKAVRTTEIDPDPDVKIRRVAVCGGAGGEFIGAAIAMGAQAYVTADIKYHDFVNYRGQILLIDAGHYETEAPIKQKFYDIIHENFPHTPVHLTATDDNPVNYA